jgi:protein-S-isoprenylcysteine O-methyltransferase Ste14
VALHPDQILALLWILWLCSWLAASFWSGRIQKRIAKLETWKYRTAMIAGCILLVPWRTPPLGEKQIWQVGYGGVCLLTVVLLAGLGLTWWARIHLGKLWSMVITRKEDHRIVDTGPYGIVRHPIYTGVIIALLATAVAEGRITALVGGVLVIFGIWLKANSEERFLTAELGQNLYGSYCRRVPMLVPFLRRH